MYRAFDSLMEDVRSLRLQFSSFHRLRHAANHERQRLAAITPTDEASALRSYATRAATIRLWRRTIRAVWPYVAMLTAAASIAMPLAFAFPDGGMALVMRGSGVGRTREMLAASLSAAGVLALTIGPIIADRVLRHFGLDRFVLPWIATVLAGAVAASIMLSTLHPEAIVGVTSALLGVGVMLSAAAVAGVLGQRVRQQYPVEAAIAELMLIVEGLRGGACRYGVRWRARAIRRLESAANAVQWGLPRVLAMHDTVNQEWLRSRSDEAAAYIRSFKRDFAWPEAAADDQLADRIRSLMRSMLVSEWSALPKVSPPAVSLRQHLTKGLRVLTIAVLPVLPLVCMRIFHIPLPEALGPYMWLAAVLWFVVALTTLFDPGVAERLSIVRSALDILRAGPRQ